MKYATEITFDGQRASLGRAVVVRTRDGDLEAATITTITSKDDVMMCGFNVDISSRYSFIPTKTEDDINALPEGAWTWPVRV